MKVYLIDDDAEEAELFAEALSRIDNTIELVWHDSVIHGLESLLRDSVQPDILFLDLNLPQVPGKELLRLLRENHITRSLPVVIYSTSISKKDIDDTAAYSVKSYLQKPEDFDTLCNKLVELVG